MHNKNNRHMQEILKKFYMKIGTCNLEVNKTYI